MKDLIKLNGFELLKIEVETQLKDYDLIEVSNDETYKEAKTQRATLNKLSKSVDDERKSITKTLKKEIDNIIALVEIKMDILDTRTTSWECKLQDKRQQEINDYYEELKIPVSLKYIQTEKWLNQTFKWKEEMSALNISIRNDLEILKSLNVEFTEELIGIYKQIVNVGEAIKEYDIEFGEVKRIERQVTFNATDEEYQKVLDFIKSLGL